MPAVPKLPVRVPAALAAGSAVVVLATAPATASAPRAHDVFKSWSNAFSDQCRDVPRQDPDIGGGNFGTYEFVLRWGNRRYGLRHITRKRNYSNRLDKRIRWALFCGDGPRRENLYDDVYDVWAKPGQVCRFRVIYSRQPIAHDHFRVKGVVTAYGLHHTGC